MLNQKIYLLIFLATIFGTDPLLALSAEAKEGTQTGGGGGSIVCFYSPSTLIKVRAQGGKLTFADLGMDERGQELPGRGPVQSIEAYDLFEAKLPHTLRNGQKNPVVDILPSERYSPDYAGNQNYSDYIERLAARFDKTVIAASQIIRDASNYRNTAIIKYPNGVAQVDDANPATDVPDVTRCALVTTALQHNEGNQLYIDFDRRLMVHSKNSQLSRAVLNLHEDLYALARRDGHLADSRPIRDFLGVILSEKIQYTQFELLNYLANLGFYPGSCGSDHKLNALDCFSVIYLPKRVTTLVIEALSEVAGQLSAYDHANSETVASVYLGKFQNMTWKQVLDWATAHESARAQFVLTALQKNWELKRATILLNADHEPLPVLMKMIAIVDRWINTSHKIQIAGTGLAYYGILAEEHYDPSNAFLVDRLFRFALDSTRITALPMTPFVPKFEPSIQREEGIFPELLEPSNTDRTQTHAVLSQIEFDPNLPATLE